MTVLSDDFTRANSTNLGAAWDESPLGGDLSIVSNLLTATAPGAQNNWAINTGSLGSPDHFAQATIGSVSASGLTAKQVNVHCRWTSTGTALANQTLYYALVYWTNGTLNGYISCGKIVAGTATNLLGDVDLVQNVAVGDIIRLECRGSQLRCFYNGVQRIGPFTDTAITTGNQAGLGLICPGAQGRAEISNWQAGSLLAPPLPPRPVDAIRRASSW